MILYLSYTAAQEEASAEEVSAFIIDPATSTVVLEMMVLEADWITFAGLGMKRDMRASGVDGPE